MYVILIYWVFYNSIYFDSYITKRYVKERMLDVIYKNAWSKIPN